MGRERALQKKGFSDVKFSCSWSSRQVDISPAKGSRYDSESGRL